jgi:putative spermidine/putrescine transport system permease protein
MESRAARALKRSLVPYALMLPAGLLVAGLALSLWQLFLASLGGGPDAPGFFQYAKIVGTAGYAEHFWYSAWYALIATAATALLAYPVAWYMEQAGAGVRRAVLAFLVLVFFSDYVLRMYGLVLVLGKAGLVNRLLLALGAVDEPLRLLYTPASVIVGMVSGSLPFMIFALNSVLARVDRSQLQAAALLGAPPFAVFCRIVFPLSVTGLVSGSVIVYLLCLNSFVTPALLGGGFVEMVATFIYDQAINLNNLQLGAAAAMLLFVLSMALLLAVNALMDRFGRRFGVQ